MRVLVLNRPVRRRLAWAAAFVLATGFLLWEPSRVEEQYQPTLATAPATSAQGALRPIYSFQTTDKVAALTFDISWGEKMPPKVLEVLKAHGVKATFFLSGPWARDHADMVRRIQADGHETQSHGQRHDNLSTLGREGVAQNLLAADQILQGLTGQKPRAVRPPNGDFDATSLAATRDVAYSTIMWSVDSLDWKNPGVGAISQRVLQLNHPGAVILMHASDSCKQTDQALPTILRELTARGYRLALLGEMMQKYPVDPAGYIRTPNRH